MVCWKVDVIVDVDVQSAARGFASPKIMDTFLEPLRYESSQCQTPTNAAHGPNSDQNS